MDKNFTTIKVNVTLDEMIEIDKNLNLSARLNIAKLEHKDLTEEDIIKEHLIGKENLRFNKIDEKLKEEKYILIFNYFDKPKNSQKLLIECIEYKAKTEEEKKKVKETIEDLQKAIRDIYGSHLIGMSYQLEKNKFYIIDMLVDTIYSFTKDNINKNIILWGGERVYLTVGKKYLKNIYDTLQEIYIEKKYYDCKNKKIDG